MRWKETAFLQFALQAQSTDGEGSRTQSLVLAAQRLLWNGNGAHMVPATHVPAGEQAASGPSLAAPPVAAGQRVSHPVGGSE